MLEIFYYDGEVKTAKPDDLEKIKGKQIWVDVTNITKDEAEILKSQFNLHPLTTEDFVKSNVRVKIETFPDYLFCVFYSIHGVKSVELTELDFVIGDNFLITNHKKELKTYVELKNDKERLDMLFRKGNDFLFHKLLDVEIENYMPILEEIDARIEHLEEEATKKPSKELLAQIMKIKRQIVKVKKCALPQREKLSALTKYEFKFITSKSLPYFRDTYDYSIKIFDTIDNCREAADSAFDVYMSSVSNNMNEVMKMLSIIATIALPLTVVSSIYGTNFSNLPGSLHPYGFWMMIALMLMISVTMLLFFRKKGWI